MSELWVVGTVSAGVIACCGFALAQALWDLRCARRLSRAPSVSDAFGRAFTQIQQESDERVRAALHNQLVLELAWQLDRYALGARLGLRICAASGLFAFALLQSQNRGVALALVGLAGSAALACLGASRVANQERALARQRWNGRLARARTARA